MIFSWAELETGQMVHVNNVPQGLACNCVCPKCRERLLARHGDIRHHGFAHHSETRGANLKICYMVTLYKLAEQMVLQHKRIRIPPYYGIFKESDVEFSEVKVDSRYDREDKQPDIIATTSDGKKYLIEFIFTYKVQHKELIDYKNLNCLEIDLSNQTLDSLKDFLLNSSQDRKWLNNEDYFNSIESLYKKHGKTIRLTPETLCYKCRNRYACGAVRQNGVIIQIYNNGKKYRLCKPVLPIRNQESGYKKSDLQNNNGIICRLSKPELPEHNQVRSYNTSPLQNINLNRPKPIQCTPSITETTSRIIPPEERTCFMCKSNLDWMCRDGEMAHCGPYPSMGVPKNTPPETAKTCKGFKPKH